MEPPLISCIVPVFNGERYLHEALDSILAQTYRPVEVIVADDGSTDGTVAVVASYGERVRYLWQPNAGSPAARNLGLGAAKGEFVAFLDADDLWHPEKLARQMARFQARPELDLSITHVQNFWIPELREEEVRFQNHRLAQPWPGYTSQALLARRTVFDTVGPFGTALREGDAKDWFLRAAEQGTVIELLPDVLVYRRLHRTNLSRRKTSADLLHLVKASLDRRRCQDEVVSRAYDLSALDRHK
jgi:glycosyltransferase involved in cell wall biosynthesis